MTWMAKETYTPAQVRTKRAVSTMTVLRNTEMKSEPKVVSSAQPKPETTPAATANTTRTTRLATSPRLGFCSWHGE
jgi:hypothetical protein